MSNMNKIEVLFKELCDEDIAYVSGGISVASRASVSDDGTGSATVTLGGTTKTVTFNNSTVPTDTSTTSLVSPSKLFLGTVLAFGSQPIQIVLGASGFGR